MDQREIMKYFEMNENKNTTYKNICDACLEEMCIYKHLKKQKE